MPVTKVGLLPPYARAVFVLELKRTLAYRIDFWIRIICTSLGRIALGVLLWKAIFEQNAGQNFGGYSFRGMALYYLLISFALNGVVIRGGFLAQEIYQGLFTRYLLYPLSPIIYHFSKTLAFLLLSVFQLALGLTFFLMVWGFPPEIHASLLTGLQALLSLATASLLYYCLSLNIEFMAFWIDRTFNLSLMLFFCTNLLGGALMPISLFPDWALMITKILPFPYLLYFPVQTFLGQVSLQEWCNSLLIAGSWICILLLSARLFLARGSREYNAVGI